MANFKIVGRFRAKEGQPSWQRGKAGTQAKKRVYTSEEDFKKYSPETIKRWETFSHYDVETYKMDENGRWILIEKSP